MPIPETAGNQFSSYKKWLILGFAVLLVLFWQAPPLRALQGADIMPLWLHTFAETFSIVVAMLIFGVGWNAYSKDRPGNIIILACAFLAVGLLDFAHTISYNGMPDFITPAGREKGINFWLAARLLAALALLVVAVRPWQPLSNSAWRYVFLAGFLAITALVYWLGLFHQPLWPRTFIEGQGLTPFKIAVEYLVIAILIVPAVMFYRQARKIRANEASYLFVAASIFILSELCFTLYSDVHDAMNLLGHAYKVVACMFLYRAIFVSSVREPFQKLNMEMAERKLAEAALKKSLQEVEDLYHNAPCGYHSLDKDGIFLQINDTELGWLGYTREELVGRTKFVDVLSPASMRTFYENYPAFMQRGWVNDLEFEFERKDGTTFPVLLNATAVMDGDGSYLMSRSTSFEISARKRAEQALQAEERHTRKLLDNLPAGIVVHGPDGSVQYLNLAAQAFFNLRHNAARGRAVVNFTRHLLREDGSTMLLEELPERKVLADGLPLKNYVVGVEVEELGKIRWALVDAFPDFDAAGAVRQVVVSFVDITERILADAQLRNTRAELEHVLNVNPAATYQVKLCSNSTFFRSKAIVDMLGYAVEAWQEPGFWISHIHPDDKEAVLMAQNLLLDKGVLQHEYRFRHQDGRWIWILDRVNVVRDVRGKAVELVGAWLNISLRKKAEIGLENLNRFYLVLSRVNEAIVRTAERDALFENICRIAVENGKFAMAWIGLVDEVKGDIFPAASWGHDAGYLDYLRTTGVLGFNGPTSQAIKSGEFRLSQNIAADPRMAPWRKEALERGYYSSAAFPLRRGGEVVGTINFYAGQSDAFDSDVLSLLKDLSADISFALSAMDQQERRHAAEERLRQLNEELERRVAERTRQLEAANKELEAFSYSVSHDLRSPLRSIDGFSEILEKRYAERLDDSGRDYLGRVRRASKRMGELIDDLLLLARVTRAELRKETVDLSSMVQIMTREIQVAAPQRQVKWIIQDAILAQADSRLIKIVLENLLGNAWKFTAHQSVPRIEFGMIEREDEKVIFLRDNGAGFDMQYAGKLFGAFQRLHKAEDFEGTGIGLATVQRIIHRHGGRVWAEGQTGAGATFFFTL